MSAGRTDPVDLVQLLDALDPHAGLAQRHLWLIALLDWVRGDRGSPQAAASRVGLFLDAVQARPDALQRLARQSWPGNIRQLNNVIKVAIALLDDDEEIIETWHLPDDIFEEISEITHQVAAPSLMNGSARACVAAPVGASAAGGMGSLEEIEREMIQRTLEAENGNISSAARRLGISRNTLYRKLGRF